MNATRVMTVHPFRDTGAIGTGRTCRCDRNLGSDAVAIKFAMSDLEIKIGQKDILRKRGIHDRCRHPSRSQKASGSAGMIYKYHQMCGRTPITCRLP